MPVTRVTRPRKKKVPSVPVVPAKRKKGEPKVEQYRVTAVKLRITNLEKFKEEFNHLYRNYCPTQRAKICICITLIKSAIYFDNNECLKWLLDTYFTKICHQDCLPCPSGDKRINITELIKYADYICGWYNNISMRNVGSYRKVSLLFSSIYYYPNDITEVDKSEATLAFMNYMRSHFIDMSRYIKPKYRMKMGMDDIYYYLHIRIPHYLFRKYKLSKQIYFLKILPHLFESFLKIEPSSEPTRKSLIGESWFETTSYMSGKCLMMSG